MSQCDTVCVCLPVGSQPMKNQNVSNILHPYFIDLGVFDGQLWSIRGADTLSLEG